MLIKKSRQSQSASEVGISTAEWHQDLYEEAPEGYRLALESGIEFVDLVAMSSAVPLIASATPSDERVSPRYNIRVVPRPTFGLGVMLNKMLVMKWSVLGPLEQTMHRLGISDVHTLTLHSDSQGRVNFPFWAVDAAAHAYQQGLCTRIGISHANMSVAAVQRISAELQRRGASLSCVFVSMSLLHRKALPLVTECRKMGLQVFATSALGREELASGRYTAWNPTGGEISIPRFTLAQLLPLKVLHEALGSVAAQARQRVEKPIDTTQVALQWICSKGASPLCDVGIESNVKAMAGCKDWSLTEPEVEQLDRAADAADKARSWH